MDSGAKKKRFIYKAVVDSKKMGNQANFISKQPSKTVFPDDFNLYASQPSKKIKLGSDVDNDQRTNDKNNDLINDINIIDNDFDFSAAANEIDQLEIAASQQINKTDNSKKNPRSSKFSLTTQTSKPVHGKSSFIYDEFNNPFENEIERSILPRNKNKDTLHLKLPEKKAPNIVLKNNGFTGMRSTANTVLKPNMIVTSNSSFVTSKICASNSNTKDQPPITEQTLQLFSTVKYDQCMSRISSDRSAVEKQLHNAQEQVHEFKIKLKETERKYNSKDGEIKILRETLRKLSEEEFRYKEKVRKLENELKTKQSEKENDLISEVERLKTQLQFKEKEVQDVLESQQKLLKSYETKKSATSPPRRTSPAASFSSDAFQKKKDFIRPSSSCTNMKSMHQSNLFKTCLGSNFKQLQLSSKIIKLLTSDIHCFRRESLNFTCNHASGSSLDHLSNRNINLILSMQSSLELIEHDSFFVAELIDKINFHLTSLQGLLTDENIGNIKTKQNALETRSSRKLDEVPATCVFCDELFTNGLQSLLVLNEACVSYESLRRYLLNGLVAFQQQQRKEEEDEKKKTIVSNVAAESFFVVVIFLHKLSLLLCCVISKVKKSKLSDWK